MVSVHTFQLYWQAPGKQVESLVLRSNIRAFMCIFLCLIRPEKEPQFKFIYFNHMNLAEKSTIHMRKTASVCLTSVHPDLMKILGDINCDFARYSWQHLTCEEMLLCLSLPESSTLF